jgi:hypothetical protein
MQLSVNGIPARRVPDQCPDPSMARPGGAPTVRRTSRRARSTAYADPGAHRSSSTDVDPDEYAAASPDPLRTIEFDLIADLADHHLPEMTGYLRRQLGPAADPAADPEVVRIDRYGLLVRTGGRLARLGFPRAVTDRHDLAHLLHPILCHRCAA